MGNPSGVPGFATKTALLIELRVWWNAEIGVWMNDVTEATIYSDEIYEKEIPIGVLVDADETYTEILAPKRPADPPDF